MVDNICITIAIFKEERSLVFDSLHMGLRSVAGICLCKDRWSEAQTFRSFCLKLMTFCSNHQKGDIICFLFCFTHRSF